MSLNTAHETAKRMNLRPVAVAVALSCLQSDLMHMSEADSAKQREMLEQRHVELAAVYGGTDRNAESKPFAYANGIAVIPVSGSLINRFASCYPGWVTGYNFISRQVQLASQDDDVEVIVLDMNSYGGEVAGCFECAANIAEAAAIKPVMAYVDTNCYSACYALASAATKIVSAPSGGAGSIGVVAMHVDFSKMMEKFGINVTFIHAGAHKVDGNPYEALSEDVKKDIQASVNKSYDKFVAHVAAGRGMDEKKVRATEARTYSADDALAVGLIDAIESPQKAVQAFLAESSGSTSQPRKEDAMSQETKPGADTAGKTHTQADVDAARKEAAAAERARTSSIMGCDEAKDRQKLASHIAMKTDMSVEDAKAMLAAAPVETVEKKADTVNPLDNAMDKTGGGAGVGADGAAGGAEMTHAERIQGLMKSAAGEKSKFGVGGV